jgi:hypothetical protein
VKVPWYKFDVRVKRMFCALGFRTWCMDVRSDFSLCAAPFSVMEQEVFRTSEMPGATPHPNMYPTSAEDSTSCFSREWSAAKAQVRQFRGPLAVPMLAWVDRTTLVAFQADHPCAPYVWHSLYGDGDKVQAPRFMCEFVCLVRVG